MSISFSTYQGNTSKSVGSLVVPADSSMLLSFFFINGKNESIIMNAWTYTVGAVVKNFTVIGRASRNAGGVTLYAAYIDQANITPSSGTGSINVNYTSGGTSTAYPYTVSLPVKSSTGIPYGFANAVGGTSPAVVTTTANVGSRIITAYTADNSLTNADSANQTTFFINAPDNHVRATLSRQKGLGTSSSSNFTLTDASWAGLSFAIDPLPIVGTSNFFQLF